MFRSYSITAVELPGEFEYTEDNGVFSRIKKIRHRTTEMQPEGEKTMEKMRTLSVQYPRSIPAVINTSPELFEEEAKTAMAVKLFVTREDSFCHVKGSR